MTEKEKIDFNKLTKKLRNINLRYIFDNYFNLLKMNDLSELNKPWDEDKARLVLDVMFSQNEMDFIRLIPAIESDGRKTVSLDSVYHSLFFGGRSNFENLPTLIRDVEITEEIKEVLFIVSDHMFHSQSIQLNETFTRIYQFEKDVDGLTRMRDWIYENNSTLGQPLTLEEMKVAKEYENAYFEDPPIS